MKKSNILVIGSLNMDWIIEVDHTPIAGETLLGHFAKEVPGGKGANQAYAASSLGGHVTMLGAVGKDPSGEKLLQSLQKAGVNTSPIQANSETGSGMAIIYLNKMGNNSIVVLPNANNTVTKEVIMAHDELFKVADIIMLQLEIPLESVYEAATLAHKYHKTIILNPAPAISHLPNEILSKIDYITPNETELSTLTNQPVSTVDDAIIAAQTLLRSGIKHVITTLGEKGAVLVTLEEARHFPALSVKAIDTTAAGDSFNGALAVYLAEGKSIEEAIVFGNQVAAITVTREGAQSSIPFREEILPTTENL